MEVDHLLTNPALESDRPHQSIAFAPEYRYLLDNIDFTLYGDAGPLLRVMLAERLAEAEYARLRYVEHETPNRNVLYDTYIAPYMPDLKRSTRGKLFLSILEPRYGSASKFREQLEELMSAAPRNETDTIWSDADVIAIGIISLMQEGEFEEARQLAAKVDPARVAPKTWMEIQAFRAVLDAYAGDFGQYTNLPDRLLEQYPCVWYVAISLLRQKIERSGGRNSGISNLILDSFDNLHKQGLASYQFYDSWGNEETIVGRYDEAMKHFAEALRYAGPHNWGLLNWGWAAFHKGDLAVARDKYRESLAEGPRPVPNAVFGLLATLARQNDTQAYLTEYQKYADLLRQQEYEYRSSYERLALLASCERYQRPPVNILKSDEMLIINGKSYQREELSDPSVCVQLNRERVRESDKRAGPRRRSRREH